MTLTFLHTADWQIGKPFGRFDEERAPVLRQARLSVIDRLAETARSAGAVHVLVAGDVLDSDSPSDALLRQLLSRLAVHSGLVWHLLPGNHDPARPGGVWERLARLGPAGNVRLLTRSAPVELMPGTVLLPAPLTAKATSSDPTAWMDAAPSSEGAVRIGLAHGSVQGFGSLGEAAVPIDPERARKAGLAYLALGDWHGVKQIGPRTWYSGTPEPDSYQDNGPGHALLVRLAAPAAAPTVTPVATAEFAWQSRHMRLTSLEDLEKGLDGLGTGGERSFRQLVTLTIEGTLPVRSATVLERRLEALAATLFSLDVDRKGLRFGAGAADIEALEEGILRRVAESLQRKAATDEAGGDAVAARALALLFAFAGRAEQEARR